MENCSVAYYIKIILRNIAEKQKQFLPSQMENAKFCVTVFFSCSKNCL